MKLVHKLRSPKVLCCIGAFLLAIPLVFFAYNKNVDRRGEILTAALQEVDVTEQSFRITFSEWCGLDPVTEEDLTAEALARLQDYIEKLQFDGELTKKDDFGEYDELIGGDTYSWVIQCAEDRRISLFGINTVIIRVRIIEKDRTVKRGIFRENVSFLEIFEK